jgi:DNA-binding MarR family transcriptional regulator
MHVTQAETVGEGEPPADFMALADDFVAVLVIAIANRLTRGASRFYRETFDLGVVEFRIMMCLDRRMGRSIGEIGDLADVDKGAVSRSVRVLIERGLIETEAAARRVVLVRLTAAGRKLAKELRSAGLAREERLLSAFDAAQTTELRAYLHRLLAQVDVMNEPG